MQTSICDLSNEHWYATNAADVTGASFPSRIPTTVKPSGDGVIAFGEGGMIAPRWCMLKPFGTGSATNTFTMQVLGWRSARTQGTTITTELWIPDPLATYAVTLGTATGIAGSAVDNNHLFATTITSTGGPTFITSGPAPIVEGWFQISPGSNGIAVISQASLGYRMLEVIFETGSSATACNALYCKR
jgi:hypothetical protein